MDITHLLVLALATFRLASLFARESGPFEMFYRFRHMVGVRYDQMSRPEGSNQFAKGLICVWCNSLWFGLLLSGLYLWLGVVVVWASLPLALSAVTIMLDNRL